jgi:hypothetical protein
VGPGNGIKKEGEVDRKQRFGMERELSLKGGKKKLLLGHLQTIVETIVETENIMKIESKSAFPRAA